MRRFFMGLTLSLAAGAWPAVASADNVEFSQSIATALRESGRLSDYSIGVASEDGVVQLDGRVANQEQLAEAIEMTQAMPGVSKVINNLQVKPSAKSAKAKGVGTTKLAGGAQQFPGSGVRTTSYPDPSTPAATNSGGGNDLVSKLRAGRNSSTASAAAKKAGAQKAASRQQAAQQAAMQQAMLQQQAMAQQMAMEQSMGSAGGPPQGMPTAMRGQGPPPGMQGMPRGLPPDQAAQAMAAGQMPPQRMAMNPVGMAAGMGAGAAGMAMGAAGAAMGGGMGSPMPMNVPAASGGVRPAGYDQPYMPNHAWPSYAAYPNYAAVTYPRQYSPTAWPYIGPFYPYPQVPLGWRKVTLEWDDGWWMLNFKD